MKIRIIKLKEPEDALYKNNIEVGFDKCFDVEDGFFEKPEVGKSFKVNGFITSIVQEVLTEDTFRTYNSIYKWEIVK